MIYVRLSDAQECLRANGTGEVGGTGPVMRSYLFQNIAGREQFCYVTIAQSFGQA